jgi:hypothetical protein
MDAGAAHDAGPGGVPITTWTDPLPPTPAAPEVRLVFPTYGATQASQVLAHGTAYQVTAVTVNGAPATLNDAGNGFTTWSAPFALDLGDNVITVAGTSTGGAPVAPTSVTVTRAPASPAGTPAGTTTFTRGSGWATTDTDVYGLMASYDGRYLYGHDGRHKGYFRAELSTGDVSISASNNAFNRTSCQPACTPTSCDPTGCNINADITALSSVFVDDGNGDPRLFWVSGNGASVYFISLVNYYIYRLPNVPTNLGGYYSAVYHQKNDRVITVGWDNSNNSTVIAIDPASGTTQILAGQGVGDNVKGVKGITLDESSGRLYHLTAYSSALGYFDLATGHHSGLPAGSGPTLGTPSAIATCKGSTVLYLLQDGPDNQAQFVVVDIATGNHQVIADSTVGAGVSLANVRMMTCFNDALYATEVVSQEANGNNPAVAKENKVISIDPATGDRLVVSFFDTTTETLPQP